VAGFYGTRMDLKNFTWGCSFSAKILCSCSTLEPTADQTVQNDLASAARWGL